MVYKQVGGAGGISVGGWRGWFVSRWVAWSVWPCGWNEGQVCDLWRGWLE